MVLIAENSKNTVNIRVVLSAFKMKRNDEKPSIHFSDISNNMRNQLIVSSTDAIYLCVMCNKNILLKKLLKIQSKASSNRIWLIRVPTGNGDGGDKHTINFHSMFQLWARFKNN